MEDAQHPGMLSAAVSRRPQGSCDLRNLGMGSRREVTARWGWRTQVPSGWKGRANLSKTGEERTQKGQQRRGLPHLNLKAEAATSASQDRLRPRASRIQAKHPGHTTT